MLFSCGKRLRAANQVDQSVQDRDLPAAERTSFCRRTHRECRVIEAFFRFHCTIQHWAKPKAFVIFVSIRNRTYAEKSVVEASQGRTIMQGLYRSKGKR